LEFNRFGSAAPGLGLIYELLARIAVAAGTTASAASVLIGRPSALLAARLVIGLLLAVTGPLVLLGLLAFGIALLKPARLIALLVGLVVFLVHGATPTFHMIVTT
jgi:hypothetical protein